MFENKLLHCFFLKDSLRTFLVMWYYTSKIRLYMWIKSTPKKERKTKPKTFSLIKTITFSFTI